MGDVHYPYPDPPREGEAVEVAEGVLWLRLPLPMRLDHVNVYALDEGDGWTIIDTGIDTQRAREVWERVLANPLKGKAVRRVLVTHHHPDHVGLAGSFQSAGAEVLATRVAWLFARMLQLDEQPTPPREAVAFWRAAGMAREVLAERQASRPFNYADIVAPMPLGFTRLRDDEEIALGGRQWRVRFGQGHAPDQATLWGIGHDLVLSADQVLPRITPNIGVYATEPGADPLGEWMETCRLLKAAAREEQLALPGHQRPFKGLPARLDALIEHHAGVLERLAEWLHQPRTAAECFAPLYGRAIRSGEYGHALVEAVAHLNHLRAQGLVARDSDADGRWLWRRL